MQVPLLCLLLVVGVVTVIAAPNPARSNLETGIRDNETPFVEEVVVEAQLQVRSPSSRQARTNTRTNLQDGARVSEAKTNTKRQIADFSPKPSLRPAEWYHENGEKVPEDKILWTLFGTG